MKIRSATLQDIPAIIGVIDEARLIMRETGNMNQWGHGYPSRELIECDITSNQAYICEADEILFGYFCFVQGKDPDPNYATIHDGSWLNNEPYGVLHRLASSGKAKGIATAAFDFAFSQASNVRVDTHHDNLPMQNFLRKAGFHYCGIVYVGDGTPRDAFQKVLS